MILMGVPVATAIVGVGYDTRRPAGLLIDGEVGFG